MVARVDLVLSFLLFCYAAFAQNPDADPWQIAFNSTASIGPDGPWWYITQAVDFPDQLLSVFPGLYKTSLIMSSGACSSAGANCASPEQPGWSPSGSYASNNGSAKQSPHFDPGDWDKRLTPLLRLDGKVFYTPNRMTLYNNGNSNGGSLAYLDHHATLVSEDLKVNFPGGAAYTLNVGLLSLYGSEEFASWTLVDGSEFQANLTMNAAYVGSYIPSKSFGLRIGSVASKISGSLILGGYDASRCFMDPIVSDTTTFKLLDISLNVTRGLSAFLKTDKSEVPGLLKINGGKATELEVQPEPGVPYLYLPKDTCDAIAEHLPVTYNEDFNLYLWDTDSPAYSEIVSSPHSLVFSFGSEANISQTANINVPFALLNLTLDAPITTQPTPYFPCSPWTSSGDVPYHLGRAFLQGAFLGANSQTNKLFLAQAPGPDYPAKDVKKITSTDSVITPALNAPDWDSTWATALKALTSSASGTGTGGTANSNGTAPTDGSSSDETDSNTVLSKGALAGIVAAGVLAIVGGAFAVWYFIFYKKRKQQLELLQKQQQQQSSSPPHYPSQAVWSAKDPTPESSTPELAGSSYQQHYLDQYQEQYQQQAQYSEKSSFVPITELDCKSNASELSSEPQQGHAAELA